MFLKYLDSSEYGIWLAIFSTVTWINFFDLGVGNGLRNRLTMCFAKNNIIQAKKFIGSALAFFFVILIILYLIFLTVSLFIDFRVFFNAINYDAEYFFNVINIIFISIILDFFFKIVDSVSYSLQNSYIPKLRVLVKNLFFIVSFFFLITAEVTDEKLLNLSLIYLYTSLFVNLSFFIIIFFKKKLLPSFNQISFKEFKPIGNMGLKFLIIQLSAIIIFSTDNFIIINYIGSEEVTQYNIIFKIFSITIIAQSFLNVPLWSAYTSKYESKNYIWIKNTFTKSIYYSVLLVFVSILILFLLKWILKIWLNDESYFEWPIALAFLFYTITRIWTSNFSTLFNGISKLNLQITCSLIGAIINIPLSIIFIKTFNLGSAGVILASTISILIFGLVAPFKLKTYLNEK